VLTADWDKRLFGGGGRGVLEVDDPRWESLRAGGTSSPRAFLPLLARLRDDPLDLDRTLGLLANHLWQQFDVGETTVAAFPHLVAALARVPPAGRASALDQVGLVAALVSEAGLSPPEDVRRAYDRAVGDCLPLALETLRAPLGEEERLWVFAAVAGLSGQSNLCNALLGLSRGTGECPECGEEIELREACRHW
jgi:hypothetical protein